MSRSSSAPKFLYSGHADCMPLPLAVRLSQIHTMMPLLREQLVIQKVRAAPRVDDLLRMRPRIRELIDRIPPSGVEVRRLDHHRFHDEPVARLHLHQLGRRQPVLLQRRNSVRVDDADQSACVVVRAAGPAAAS